MTTENEDAKKIEVWILSALFALSLWFRPFVAVALWRAHLVPMGAPPVGFWWMVLALMTVSPLICGLSKGATTEKFARVVIRAVVHLLTLLIIWLWLT